MGARTATDLPPIWANAGGSGGGWLLAGNMGTNPVTDFLGTTDSVDLVIKTNNKERLRLAGSGYVGIGGLAIPPRALLDVTGILPGSNLITMENDASNGYTSIDMRDNFGQLVGTLGYANSGAGSFAGRNYFNVYNKDFVITALGANANNIFLQGSSTGYVGIGTDAPQQRLHVNGNLQLDGALMPGGDAGTAGQVLYSQGPDLPPLWQAASGGSAGWGIFGNSGTNSGIDFMGTTDNVSLRVRTNDIERMVIDSMGNIGIGTTVPTNRLSVLALADPLYLGGVQATSTFSSDSILTINAGVVRKAPYSALPSGSGGSGWLLNGNDGTDPITQFLGTTDAKDFIVRTNNVERMRIKDVTGNIGIGTANPNSALDVKGALRLTGSTSGFVGFQPAANAGSTTYTLPAADGTSGQMLTTDGGGGLSWTTPSGGGGSNDWGFTNCNQLGCWVAIHSDSRCKWRRYRV